MARSISSTSDSKSASKNAADERPAALLDHASKCSTSRPRALAVARSDSPKQLSSLNVFRTMLHQESVTKAVAGTLTTLLYTGNRLDTRLRELVIMRIGWTTGSCYEWTQHWRVARGLDIPEAHLLAVRDWTSARCFSALERAALAATDETLTGRLHLAPHVDAARQSNSTRTCSSNSSSRSATGTCSRSCCRASTCSWKMASNRGRPTGARRGQKRGGAEEPRSRRMNADPPERRAELVLVDPNGNVIGKLPPVPTNVSWWPEVETVVRAVRERFGLDVTILRLLNTDRYGMAGGTVTYLAEVDGARRS